MVNDRRIKHLQHRCDFCGTCVGVCPKDAIDLAASQLQIIVERCTVCGFCVAVCPIRALEMVDEERI